MNGRPALWRNPWTLIGASIAVLAFVSFVFLWVYDTLSPGPPAPYAGIVIFVVTPAIMFAGMGLALWGWWWNWRRWRRMGAEWVVAWPVIDLNDERVRVKLVAAALAATAFLFLTAFGSFQAYEATESVPFCGELCHAVMGPEYTAYRLAPHAQVACVECHVGSGADWYLRSKVSGLRQLYAYVTDTYHRPIPVPVHSLRPAAETCQTCHWPEKQSGYVARRYVYFLADEENTRWETDMELFVGGGRSGAPGAGGIHWHMQIEHIVEYIATDSARTTVPWVRTTNRLTGETTLYRSPDAGDDLLEGATWRSMDCMDCHNRPAHAFHSPRDLVNRALAAGALDPRLPSLKQAAVELLAEEYPTTDAALAALGSGLSQFYKDNTPEVAEQKRETIEQAIAELQRMYRENFFPEMKVRWDAYPSNASHLFSPGCFRCHDGRHQAEDGRVIRSDCNLCHAVRAQGPPDRKQYAASEAGLEFEHPADVGSDWKDSPCHECHSGAAP